MVSRKRKFVYWVLKFWSVVISCAFPIWAIYERYPLWVTEHGTSHSIGAGGILVFAVLLIVCRRPVFKFMRDRLKLRYAPPLVVWLVLILISYGLLYLSKFLYDMTNVFWMGFIGCAIGTVLTFIAENFIRKVKVENG